MNYPVTKFVNSFLANKPKDQGVEKLLFNFYERWKDAPKTPIVKWWLDIGMALTVGTYNKLTSRQLGLFTPISEDDSLETAHYLYRTVSYNPDYLEDEEYTIETLLHTCKSLAHDIDRSIIEGLSQKGQVKPFRSDLRGTPLVQEVWLELNRSLSEQRLEWIVAPPEVTCRLQRSGYVTDEEIDSDDVTSGLTYIGSTEDKIKVYKDTLLPLDEVLVGNTEGMVYSPYLLADTDLLEGGFVFNLSCMVAETRYNPQYIHKIKLSNIVF